jgi:hypothetical protein
LLNVNIKIFKTVILQVVLCGGENWSVTLSEESTVRVSENSELRVIFGFKSYEVPRKWVPATTAWHILRLRM